MKIIIFGSGMYVTGRGTNGDGVLLPSILQYFLGRSSVSVEIVCSGSDSRLKAEAVVARIEKKLEYKFEVRCTVIDLDAELATLGLLFKGYKCSIAFVALPDRLHFKVTERCLEYGAHCFVVKPFSTNKAQALRLIELAEKNNVVGVVDYHKRFDRQNLIIRDNYRHNHIGALSSVLVEYSQRISVPTKFFKSWASETNPFQYIGCHYVDLIHYITEALPLRVMAIGSKGVVDGFGINVFDSVTGIIEWKIPTSDHVFLQTICVGWIDPDCSTAMSEQRIKLVGAKGFIDSDQKRRGLVRCFSNSQYEDVNPDYCQSAFYNGRTHWFGYGIDSVHSFIKRVEGDTTNQVCASFRDALISATVIESVNVSLENNGKWEACFVG